MSISEDFLNIIDQRIDQQLKSSNTLCRYSGQIIHRTENNRYQVSLLGYDTIFTFPARSYINAQEGDYILIECKGNNLSNGIIVDIAGNGSTPQQAPSNGGNGTTVLVKETRIEYPDGDVLSYGRGKY